MNRPASVPTIAVPTYSWVLVDQFLFGVQLVLLGTAIWAAYFARGLGQRPGLWPAALFMFVVAVVTFLSWFLLRRWMRARPLVRKATSRLLLNTAGAFLLPVRGVHADGPHGARLRGRTRLAITCHGIFFDNGALGHLHWSSLQSVCGLPTGVELRTSAATTLFVATTSLPLVFGPLDHYPELGRSVAGTAVDALNFNEALARRMNELRRRVAERST